MKMLIYPAATSLALSLSLLRPLFAPDEPPRGAYLIAWLRCSRVKGDRRDARETRAKGIRLHRGKSTRERSFVLDFLLPRGINTAQCSRRITRNETRFSTCSTWLPRLSFASVREPLLSCLCIPGRAFYGGILRDVNYCFRAPRELWISRDA